MTVLQPAKRFSLFDIDVERSVTISPEGMSCQSSVLLQELCGDISAMIETGVQDAALSHPSFVCYDASKRPLVIQSQTQWENHGLEVCLFVPLWMAMDSSLHAQYINEKGSSQAISSFVASVSGVGAAMSGSKCGGALRSGDGGEMRSGGDQLNEGGGELNEGDELNDKTKTIFLLTNTQSIQFQGTETNWSSPIDMASFTSTGLSQMVTMTDFLPSAEKPIFEHSLSIHSVATPPPFRHSLMIVVNEAHHLLNNSDVKIEVKQMCKKYDSIIACDPHSLQELPFVYGVPRLFKIRCMSDDYDWSTSSILIGFKHVTKPVKEEKLVYCKSRSTNERRFLQVTTEYLPDGCVNLVVNNSAYNPSNLPVVIMNHSVFTILAQQLSDDKTFFDAWDIPSFHTSGFYWEDEQARHSVSLYFYNSDLRQSLLPGAEGNPMLYHAVVPCDQSRYKAVFEIATHDRDKTRCVLEVHMEQLKSVLLISIKGNSSLSPTADQPLARATAASRVASKRTRRFSISVLGIQATLINTTGCDIACASAQQLVLNAALGSQQDISFTLHSFQVDNQLLNAQYSTVLWFAGEKDKDVLSLHFIAENQNIEDLGQCRVVTDLSLHVEPIRVVLESALLKQILRLVKELRGADGRDRIIYSFLSIPNAEHISLPEYVAWVESLQLAQLHERNPPVVVNEGSQSTAPPHDLNEEKRVYLKSVTISALQLSISLAIGETFRSSFYDYYTLKDGHVLLPPVCIRDEEAKTVDGMMAKLKSVYLRAFFFQLHNILLYARWLAAPQRCIAFFIQDLKTFVNALYLASGEYNVVKRSAMVVAGTSSFLKCCLTNLLVMQVDVAMSCLSLGYKAMQMGRRVLRRYWRWGYVTNYSPFLPIHKKSRNWFMLGVGTSLHRGLIWLSRLNPLRPFGYCLHHLDQFRQSVETEPRRFERCKAPNVSIRGVVLVVFWRVFES